MDHLTHYSTLEIIEIYILCLVVFWKLWSVLYLIVRNHKRSAFLQPYSVRMNELHYFKCIVGQACLCHWHRVTHPHIETWHCTKHYVPMDTRREEKKLNTSRATGQMSIEIGVSPRKKQPPLVLFSCIGIHIRSATNQAKQLDPPPDKS